MSNKRIDMDEFEDLQHSWRTRSGIYDELFSHWISDRKEEIMAELKRCYERIDNAESALREIWDHQINNVGGYNITEILQYYKNAYGLNIEPEEQ